MSVERNAEGEKSGVRKEEWDRGLGKGRVLESLSEEREEVELWEGER